VKNARFNKLTFSDQNTHDLLKEYSSTFKWETVWVQEPRIWVRTAWCLQCV